MAEFIGLASFLIDLTLVIGGRDVVDETTWNVKFKRNHRWVILLSLGES